MSELAVSTLMSICIKSISSNTYYEKEIPNDSLALVIDQRPLAKTQAFFYRHHIHLKRHDKAAETADYACTLDP